uniref:Uncharacterized protein n=1 Tax=Ixodes ricinus TaxID=34613 RepID=A0A0K8REW1_IXORI
MGTVNCTLRNGFFIRRSRADSSRHKLPRVRPSLTQLDKLPRNGGKTHFQPSPLHNFAESFRFYCQSCKLLRKSGI